MTDDQTREAELAITFARVKPKVEELLADLQGVAPEDELLILQLLISRWAAAQKFNPRGLLVVLAKNFSEFIPMWEAAIHGPQDPKIVSLDGHPSFRRKP